MVTDISINRKGKVPDTFFTSRARAGIAYLWVAALGRPGRPLAGPLGTRPAAVYKAVQWGRATAGAWERLLKN